jgi:hypothetical protein
VINGVEGRKQLALDAVIAWCGSRNRDQLATVKRGRVDDAPAIAASSDEVSGVKNLHRSNDRLVAKNDVLPGGISESRPVRPVHAGLPAERGNRRARRRRGLTVVRLCKQS